MVLLSSNVTGVVEPLATLKVAAVGLLRFTVTLRASVNVVCAFDTLSDAIR